ncbi:MAG: FliG C-terminal domain-containing protein [Pseudomonadota bacterium]
MTATNRAAPVPAPLLTQAHKAAVILAALSPETATAIVEEISDAHLKAFALAFSDLKSVPASLLHAVAQEFIADVERSESELAGGVAEAQRMLQSLAEGERVNRILAELHGGGAQSVWTRLAAVKAERLIGYLKTQRTPIAAAITAQLPFEQAAALLSAADAAFAQAMLSELSRARPPSREILETIAAAVEEEFLKPLANTPGGDGVNEIVGEIINFLPSAKREAFLAHLDSEDEEIGAAVRKSVLTFEDLYLRLPEAGAAALLRAVEKETLLAALKYGKSNAARSVDFLLANVSKRMAEQYSEEMSAMPDLNEEEGERAQREVMNVVRSLARDGSIKLASPPPRENAEVKAASRR